MFIADFHIHSKFARATSGECVPEYLDLWAGKKGIDLLGTGDITHPLWRGELKEKLEPAEGGLYKLKKEYKLESLIAEHETKFILTGEISSIYKKNGKVRKIHNVIIFSGFDTADAFAAKLESLGANIRSDGRPIVGIDSRDLLEMALDADDRMIFIPAHIWTPHFSLFGKYSGFDSIEECFEDLTPHIHALETGLSSDPPMNRMVSALDKYLLVSNSDAHSPANLAREANVFNCGLNYDDVYEAINGDRDKFYGTLEFYPEEGKYHFDGHRKCGICLAPSETVKLGGVCPVCGGRITVGVLHRVEELADRDSPSLDKDKPFERIVPLTEVIASSVGMSSGSVKVKRKYEELLSELGSELYIIREAPIDEIEKRAGELIAAGIKNLREGKVEAAAGFDGEYGKVTVLSAEERDRIEGQLTIDGLGGITEKRKISKKDEKTGEKLSADKADNKKIMELSEPQKEAAGYDERAIAVIAGPGSGKTRTLIKRIETLINEKEVEPSDITAVTFTNRAAKEIKERLETAIGKPGRKVNVGTFHSVCLKHLRNAGIIGEAEALETAGNIINSFDASISPAAFLNAVSMIKNGLNTDSVTNEMFDLYNSVLEKNGLLDFDDILIKAAEKDIKIPYLLVDEFQDINALQYGLIKKWAEDAKSVFIIGDPDQSIYGFRGADSGCFERFAEDFAPVKIIRLDKNYRSTPQIVEFSSHIIGNGIKPASDRKDGEKIREVRAETAFAEGVFIAKEINRMTGGIDMTYTDGGLKGRRETGIRGFSDMAVLYRTNRQAEIIEECLKKEGIPYKVYGRDKFLRDSDVIKAVKYMKTLPQSRKPSTAVAEYISENRLENSHPMARLYSTAVMYKNISEFINAVLTGTEGDVIRSGGRERQPDCVSLLTFHASKGLEFPVVFIAGASEGTAPLALAEREGGLDKERRLFYVAATRAEDELIIVSEEKRSRFLEGVPAEIIKDEKASELKRTAKQLSLF